jgi:hypothetical protein
MAMNFDNKLEILRNLADHLVSYNFPLGPMENEYDIACLKKNEIEVDGYTAIIHFNKASYGDYYLETFQVYNKYAPFLPFSLVTKLAKKALGSHLLSLVEFYQKDYKIYCWSVCVDKRGRPISSPIQEKSKIKNFEGFEYSYMKPEQLNLY